VNSPRNPTHHEVGHFKFGQSVASLSWFPSLFVFLKRRHTQVEKGKAGTAFCGVSIPSAAFGNNWERVFLSPGVRRAVQRR
jgi:hypothetical protein